MKNTSQAGASSAAEMEWAFPDVDAGLKPLGGKVLCQIRRPKMKTKGGIILSDSDMEAEKWNTQVAKVIAVGPVAFHNKETCEPWPEGPLVEAGSFVRVPKYGKDQWEVEVDGNPGEPALFVLVNDFEISGLITCDPLSIKAYI